MHDPLENVYKTNCIVREFVKFDAEPIRIQLDMTGAYDSFFGHLKKSPAELLDHLFAMFFMLEMKV